MERSLRLANFLSVAVAASALMFASAAASSDKGVKCTCESGTITRMGKNGSECTAFCYGKNAGPATAEAKGSGSGASAATMFGGRANAKALNGGIAIGEAQPGRPTSIATGDGSHSQVLISGARGKATATSGGDATADSAANCTVIATASNGGTTVSDCLERRSKAVGVADDGGNALAEALGESCKVIANATGDGSDAEAYCSNEGAKVTAVATGDGVAIGYVAGWFARAAPISLGVAAGIGPLVAGPAVAMAARLAGNADPTSPSPSVTETVLYSFCSQPDHTTGACLDGETPGGLFEGSDGNFYGFAEGGFVTGGVIFQLTPSGTLTTLHTFCPTNNPNLDDCLDGYGPSDLIEGSDGNFYGAASTGGAHSDRGGISAGTLYTITPSGTLTTLYSFCAQVDPSSENCLDGELPDRLIEGSDGNFYGTTNSGGANSFGGARPAGTIFKMTPSGTLTTLYSFCSQQNVSTVTCLDGEEPVALIEGSDGNFYGMTPVGGQFGVATTSGGTVFKLTPSGTLTTMYSFCSRQDPTTGNCLDGNGPAGSLIQGSDGNFYGTTSGGGAYDEGTVFKLSPSGMMTTLYSFCSQGDSSTHDCLDGADPNAGVIEGSDGNFYGTTQAGGEFDTATMGGTVFMLTPAGEFTTLYSFCSQLNPGNITDCLDGAEPDALIETSDGNFYGTTQVGGANGDFGFGTTFRLNVTFPTIGPGSVTISPGQRSFGRTTVGDTRSEAFEVRAHSPKNSAASILLESFTITGGGDYALDPMTTCQQGQMLEDNQKCAIVVDFMPANATKGLTDTGTLVVTTNAQAVHPKQGMVRLKGGGKPR